jgi:arabinan endo-1,5-alpha-L-arabinosidase
MHQLLTNVNKLVKPAEIAARWRSWPSEMHCEARPHAGKSLYSGYKPQVLQTAYTNPLSADDFPDPSVVKVSGKGYYAYATHDQFSPSVNNILVKHSNDLVNWSPAKGALLAPPGWAVDCQRFWCPHVVEVNGQFRLYYAAEPDSKDGMCLALAVSDHPYDFTDTGAPLLRLEEGSTYQMIDPCLFIDPVSGRHLLYYGSAHEPIRVVEMGPEGRSFLSAPVEVLHPGEHQFHRLREGAFVTYNATTSRYFLWVSGDNTWAEGGYAISLFWSADPMGQFEKIPADHLLLRPNAYWDSPGQNCIIADEEGTEWIIYHAVDSQDRFIPGTDRFKRKMCMDRVLYTPDGWPYVQAPCPSHLEQTGPVSW